MGLHFPVCSRPCCLPAPPRSRSAGCLVAGGRPPARARATRQSGATPNPNGKTEGAECTVGFDCRSGLCKDSKCAAVCGRPELVTDRRHQERRRDRRRLRRLARAEVRATARPAPSAATARAPSARRGTCASPAPTDGVKNGDETDVDCGGAKAPEVRERARRARRTPTARRTRAPTRRSASTFKGCTGHFGGDTCGAGETGAADAKHESCCTRSTSRTVPPHRAAPFTIDKYLRHRGPHARVRRALPGQPQAVGVRRPRRGGTQSLTPTLPENMDDVLVPARPGAASAAATSSTRAVARSRKAPSTATRTRSPTSRRTCSTRRPSTAFRGTWPRRSARSTAGISSAPPRCTGSTRTAAARAARPPTRGSCGHDVVQPDRPRTSASSIATATRRRTRPRRCARSTGSIRSITRSASRRRDVVRRARTCTASRTRRATIMPWVSDGANMFTGRSRGRTTRRT